MQPPDKAISMLQDIVSATDRNDSETVIVFLLQSILNRAQSLSVQVRTLCPFINPSPLPPALTHSLIPPPSLPLSLPPLPPYFTISYLPPSLPPSLPSSLPAYLPPSLLPFITHSLPHSPILKNSACMVVHM